MLTVRITVIGPKNSLHGFRTPSLSSVVLMESQSEKSDEARDPSSTTPSTHTTNRAGNIFIMGSEALRNHPPVAQAPDRPLGEIISQEFSPFDAETLIAKPFVDHETSDDKFEVGGYFGLERIYAPPSSDLSAPLQFVVACEF